MSAPRADTDDFQSMVWDYYPDATCVRVGDTWQVETEVAEVGALAKGSKSRRAAWLHAWVLIESAQRAAIRYNAGHAAPRRALPTEPGQTATDPD